MLREAGDGRKRLGDAEDGDGAGDRGIGKYYAVSFCSSVLGIRPRDALRWAIILGIIYEVRIYVRRGGIA